MFWLSHHRADALHRTYKVAGLHVCARCLGTYPVLVAALAAQIASRAPLSHPADPFIAVGLTLPALVDWAVGQFRPHAGGNGLRTATGVLLGLSLGRTLYVHFQRPFHLWLLAQLGLCLVVSIPVLVLSLRKRRVE